MRGHALEKSFLACFKDFYLLREGVRQHERWRSEGEADYLLSKEQDVGLHPELQDRDLSLRLSVNQLSHPGALEKGFRKVFHFQEN